MISLQEDTTPSRIFVVGMNGSGTTMLRDHLANHSMVYGFPAETRTLPYFILHQADYGNLEIEHNFLNLWQDLKKSVAQRGGLLPENLPLPDASARSAAGTFDHIMKFLANTEDKKIWCEKTPMYVHHIGLLANAFPDAKFIHIIRDGRDCAASFHRRWRFNAIGTIVRWKKAVRAGMQAGQLLGPRYREIRYEDITKAPDAAFRSLLAFLNLPFEASVLTSARSKPEADGSYGPTVVRNVRNVQEYFSRGVVERMEAVAGSLLGDLGYDCGNTMGDIDPPEWRFRWWRVTDDIRRFVMVSLMGRRVLRPKKWRYIVARTRNALKQRATLK